jgi:SAM-dependent methyltransferase
MYEPMDSRVKSCCAEFYELPIVALLLGDELHPGGPVLTRKLAGTALVGRDTDVLDVACGRGESARTLASHFGCRVTGIDYSARNIAQAKELTKAARLSSRARFVQGDAETLPFDTDSFDVVMCECSLCIFPQVEAALQEIRRVLRPGGRVGITDVVLNRPPPDSLNDTLGHVLCISGARSMDGYCDALCATGFSTIRTRDVSGVLCDMIKRIERRLHTVRNLLNQDALNSQDDFALSHSAISAARDFVISGGVGYALISGKKRLTSGGR